VSRRAALIDGCLALVVAVLALTLTSLGILAVIGAAVLVLVGLTFLVEVALRRGRRSRGRR
jgi:predicted RND superfamily exporter protein